MFISAVAFESDDLAFTLYFSPFPTVTVGALAVNRPKLFRLD
jgi:hypothetical protein